MSDVLARLAAELRAEGGLLADAVVEAAPGDPTPHGDAVAGRGAEYPLIVEAIREGYLLHYAIGRVVATPDPDLALLAGDRLFALGLARLARLGDLRAVRVLADVISLCAQSHAEGDGARAERVWDAGAAAVAAEHERAAG